MKILFMILGVLIFFAVSYVHAEYEESLEDSIMRAEILGENDGKILAKKNPDYEPDKVKEECEATYFSKWEDHFKEKGFKTDPEVVTAFVDWCVKGYNEKAGK